MIFSFYSKAERNGEITLGQNKILHLWCGSLQGSLSLCTVDRGGCRRHWCLYPSLLLPPSLGRTQPLPPTSTSSLEDQVSLCPSVERVRRRRDGGGGGGGGGLFWSMAGNQTMGREDVKQIGPITYLPTRIPQSRSLSFSLSLSLSFHLFLAHVFCVTICNSNTLTHRVKLSPDTHTQTRIRPQNMLQRTHSSS